MDNVVGEQKYLKETDIGNPVFGWDFAERRIAQQFANTLLDNGSLGMESPDSPRMGFQIGRHKLIGIPSILEEGPLLSFDRISGDRAPYNRKAMAAPTLDRLVLEFPDFPCVPELSESALACAAFDRRVFPRHNHVASPAGVEALDRPL
jgi:hypothetical protein